MTTPPTWRDLGRRARRLGRTMQAGEHTARIVGHLYVESWLNRRKASIILRTAVAAALEQLEAGR